MWAALKTQVYTLTDAWGKDTSVTKPERFHRLSRSPPAGSALLIAGFAAAIPLGVALTIASLDRRPLEDPDLALQRPGFLDAHSSPFEAPHVTQTLPRPGERLVVFFVRPAEAAPLELALRNRKRFSPAASVAVVVSGSTSGRREGPAVWIPDPGSHLAAGFRMRLPRDGGPPVGYALVDTAGRVRYRTLDSTMAQRLEEVETMLRATP